MQGGAGAGRQEGRRRSGRACRGGRSTQLHDTTRHAAHPDCPPPTHPPPLLRSTQLQRLVVVDDTICSASCTYLSDLLATSHSLAHLDLSGNLELGDKGVQVS